MFKTGTGRLTACVLGAFVFALCMIPAVRVAAEKTPLAIPDHVYFTDIQGMGCEIWDDKCKEGSAATPDMCVSWFGNTPTMNGSKNFPWIYRGADNHLCAQNDKWWHSGERFDMERAIEKFVTKNYGPEVHEDRVMNAYFKDYLTRADLVVIFARLLNAIEAGAPFTLEADANTRVLSDKSIPTPHGDYKGRNEVLNQRTNEPKLYDDVRAIHPSFRYMEEVVDTAIFEHVHTLKGLRASLDSQSAPAAPAESPDKDGKKGKKDKAKDKDKKEKKDRMQVTGAADYEWKDVERSANPLEDYGKDRRAFPEQFVSREEFIAAFVSLVDYIAKDIKNNDAKYSFQKYYCGPAVNQGYDNFKYYAGIVDQALKLNVEYTRFSDVSLAAGDIVRREDVDAAQNYPGFIVVAAREGLIDISSGVPDVRLKPDRFMDRSEAVAILSKFFLGNWNQKACPGGWDADGIIDMVDPAGAVALKDNGKYNLDGLAYLYVRDCWKGNDVAEVREISTQEFLDRYAGGKLNTRKLCYLNTIEKEKAEVQARIQDMVSHITWHQRTYEDTPAQVETLIDKATNDGWDKTLRSRVAENKLSFAGLMENAEEAAEGELTWPADADAFDVFLRIPPEQSQVKGLCVPDRASDSFKCIERNGSPVLGYLEVDMAHREHAPKQKIATFRRYYGRVTGVDQGLNSSTVSMLLLDPATGEAKDIHTFTLDIPTITGSRSWSKAIKMPGQAFIDQKEPVLGEVAIVYTLQYHGALEPGSPDVPGITDTVDPSSLAEQVVLYQPEVWRLWGRLHAMQLEGDDAGDTRARLAVELRIDPLTFDRNNHFRKGCEARPALYANPNDSASELLRTGECAASPSMGRQASNFSAGGYNLVLNRIKRSNMAAACADRYEPWTRAAGADYDFCKESFDIFPYLQYSQGVGAWNIYTQSLLGADKKPMVNVMAEEISLRDK